MTRNSMLVLYAAYALTFLVMGALVWIRIGRTSRLGIARRLPLLVAFAFVHGASDVMDIVLRWPGLDPSPTSAAAAFRISLLAASFVFLLLFGAMSFIESVDVLRTVYIVGMIALVGVTAALTAMFAEGTAAGSIADVERATRLFIALPGGLIAAAGLLRTGNQCATLGMRQCLLGARIAATGMTFYAILAGAFATGYPQVLRLFGLPIQTHRMVAAVLLAAGLIIMLDRMAVHPSSGRALT